MSAKSPKNALPKNIMETIDKFAEQPLELNKNGNPKWAKASIKKLSGVSLVKNTEGLHLNFNDGAQRFGYNVKDWNSYSQMKAQMLMNFVNNVDYLDSLAKYVFEHEGGDSEIINSI